MGMLVSDFACREMTESSTSLVQRWNHLLRRHRRTSVPNPDLATAAPDEVPPPALLYPQAVRDDEQRFRWRKHPLLLRQAADDPGERQRTAATRGLFLARSGQLDDAREAFREAAQDPTVDLSALPGFWDLSRGGMLAAVDAYEATSRFRDAAALAARIRLRYRPRVVSQIPGTRKTQVN
jgi:hypothetical protein